MRVLAGVGAAVAAAIGIFGFARSQGEWKASEISSDPPFTLFAFLQTDACSSSSLRFCRAARLAPRVIDHLSTRMQLPHFRSALLPRS
jgi:hypothetical protein